MRKIAGIVVSMAIIFGLGLSVVQAETVTYSTDEYRVADTPNKYGFKGFHYSSHQFYLRPLNPTLDRSIGLKPSLNAGDSGLNE